MTSWKEAFPCMHIGSTHTLHYLLSINSVCCWAIGQAIASSAMLSVIEVHASFRRPSCYRLLSSLLYLSCHPPPLSPLYQPFLSSLLAHHRFVLPLCSHVLTASCPMLCACIYSVSSLFLYLHFSCFWQHIRGGPRWTQAWDPLPATLLLLVIVPSLPLLSIHVKDHQLPLYSSRIDRWYKLMGLCLLS